MNTEAINLIQEAQVLDDVFDKATLIQKLQDLPHEQFNSFCKEIMLLTHYYDSTSGASVCDDANFIQANKEKFWRLNEIDFSAPVSFRRLENGN